MMAVRGGSGDTWDDVFGAAQPEHVALAVEARAVILRLHSEAVERACLDERAVSFGFGMQKKQECYAYLTPLRSSVNMGFYQGSRLPDPGRLLRGTGRVLRHVKLRTRADLERPELAGLLAAAIAERAVHLNAEVA